MADKTEVGEVEGFLIQNNLSSYTDAFINAGYDDMQQIKDIVASNDKAETDMFLQDVGLHLKPGHKRRFIAGVQVLSSKERTSNQNTSEKGSKKTAEKASKLPRLVEDLIIPNPITKKIEYYNELTVELYEAIYDMIPYLQFKSYVLGQRVTRSKIRDSVSNIILKVDKILDPNNKDGNAINVTKYSSALTSISVSDVHCIENTKLKVEKFLQELSDVKETIEASRSSLFNEKMIVKPWKANELVFHDKQIEVIQEKVKELNNIHSKISANALTLKRKFPESIAKSSETKRRKTRQAENKKKSETRKKKRLAIKCKEVCKIVAPHINFDEVAAKKVQVTEENLNKECASELSVRFHLDALKHTLESNYFDERAEVFVKRLLANLESLKESRSVLHMERKKAKEEKDKSKQRTLFSCFQRNIEISKESSSSCESASSDSDCL